MVLDKGESNREFSTFADVLERAVKIFGSFDKEFDPNKPPRESRIFEDVDVESSAPLAARSERVPTTAFKTEGKRAEGFVIDAERDDIIESFKAPVFNPEVVAIEDNTAPAAAATSSGSGFPDSRPKNAPDTLSTEAIGAGLDDGSTVVFD